MAELLDGAADLVLIAGLLVCIGLLYGAKWLAQALRAIFDFSIFGYKPLGWVVDALAGLIEDGANAGIRASDKALAGLFSGLVSSLELLIGVPILLAVGVKDALAYFWHHALEPRILSIANPIRAIAASALAKVTALATTVAADLLHAERYAEAQATAALNSAEAFATREALRAEHAAESYADEAVGALRRAEDAAVANAVHIGAAALGGAEAAFDSALAGVRGIAVGAEHDLETLAGGYGIIGAAGLIAAIPALSTLVHSLATDTGLENEDCRQKVKGICGTDPSRWAKLLTDLALLGAAFDLKLVYDVANAVIGELGETMIALEDAAWGQFA